MIKLVDLLNEIDIPKNKWVTIPASELKDYSEEIYKLIDNAYAPIGGHPNYKSADNVTGREAEAEYEVIDLDSDPEIDAVSAAKPKAAGKKFTATGHDGSSPAKRAVITHKIDRLKQPGYYVEVSGKIKDILLKAGVPQVTDEATIEKVLAGKDVTMNDDGSYVRSIGGNRSYKNIIRKTFGIKFGFLKFFSYI